MTQAGWVWPPILLALAVWMGVVLRRAIIGRSRWLLYPVVGLLAVGAVGGMAESLALAHDQNTYAMPGTSYDVGGHRVHLNCVGSGSPTVVLDSGLGETSPMWDRITTAVGRTTRVCAYDRPGQGWSGDATGPQDGLAIAVDLHTLLERAGESGPYVLAGHSTGGAYAMTYAAWYPGEIAGMVLLDSAGPDQFTVLPDFAGFYAVARPVIALLPSLGRLGAGQLLALVGDSGLPEPAAAQVRAFQTIVPGTCAARATSSACRGHGHRRTASRLVHRPGPAGDVVEQQQPPSRTRDARGVAPRPACVGQLRPRDR